MNAKREKLFLEWFERIMSGDIPEGQEWIGERIFFYFKYGQQINFTKDEFSVIMPQVRKFLDSFNSLLDSE